MDVNNDYNFNVSGVGNFDNSDNVGDSQSTASAAPAAMAAAPAAMAAVPTKAQKSKSILRQAAYDLSQQNYKNLAKDLDDLRDVIGDKGDKVGDDKGDKVGDHDDGCQPTVAPTAAPMA